jgi:hypothetical protein
MLDLTEYFYREVVGYYPFKTDREECITRCTIQYLEDSNVLYPTIMLAMQKFANKGYIAPDDLPEEIWQDSLTKKGQYYMNHWLHILPPTPKILNGKFVSYPFYCEMTARFTIKDLVNLFYKQVGDNEHRNDARLEAGMKTLLNKFSGFKIEALDLILFLIDEAHHEHKTMFDAFDLSNASFFRDVLTQKENELKCLHEQKKDKIIWRDYIMEGDSIKWQIHKI